MNPMHYWTPERIAAHRAWIESRQAQYVQDAARVRELAYAALVAKGRC